MHGNISNGIGNEFNNLNIANGIWGGLDALLYFFNDLPDGLKDPRHSNQPWQSVVCNGNNIISHNDNRIRDTFATGGSTCGLAPNFLNTTKIYSKSVEYIVKVYPNPTTAGRINVWQNELRTLNYKIYNTGGLELGGGVVYNLVSEIALPEQTGMYYILFYREGAVVAKFKVIRI